jgi:hypothetical protein
MAGSPVGANPTYTVLSFPLLASVTEKPSSRGPVHTRAPLAAMLTRVSFITSSQPMPQGTSF